MKRFRNLLLAAGLLVVAFGAFQVNTAEAGGCHSHRVYHRHFYVKPYCPPVYVTPYYAPIYYPTYTYGCYTPTYPIYKPHCGYGW